MSKLKVEYVKTEDLVPYANNAKIHTGEQVEQIKKSIQDYGMDDPIAVWKNNEIIEGHGRLLACKELGIKEVPVIRLDDLSNEQRRAYALVHNKLTMNSDFDLGMLDLELDNLPDFDAAFYDFDTENDVTEYEIEKGSLVEKFTVPPFSVLDTRQGYWQDRKREWLRITGDLSETRDGEYGRISAESILDTINGGTSNFDPVLAEIMFSWFARSGDKILDPFGGEQTKGVVAGELGYSYTGVEIRREQVDVNTEATGKYKRVRYICGDSNELEKLLQGETFNMCFTSPPYYDLEVYSKEDLSALGTYNEFMGQYANIFRQCYNLLQEDSFLVLKLGEIRDKRTGEYRAFIADNIKLLTDIGFKYYNELVLINSVGTGAQRVNRAMRTRKIVKLHQNVLVFYKGETRNINKVFPKLEEVQDVED